mgnify:CR=1 FL=1
MPPLGSNDFRDSLLKGILMEDEIKTDLETVYLPSEDMVIREMQGEFVIIPLKYGMADLEDEVFKLSGTAKAMWDKLNARKTLREIAQELNLEYDAPLELIERDLLQLAEELLKRRMLVAVSRA